MMRISKDWLRRHGVAGNDENLQEIAQLAEAALGNIVRDALVASLDEDQNELFDILYAGRTDILAQLAWLEHNCVGYEQIVERVTADFKKAIAESEYPITFILGQADK